MQGWLKSTRPGSADGIRHGEPAGPGSVPGSEPEYGESGRQTGGLSVWVGVYTPMLGATVGPGGLAVGSLCSHLCDSWHVSACTVLVLGPLCRHQQRSGCSPGSWRV